MSKYLPLATFLRRQKTETVVLTFAEIERIVSGLLPKASADPAWWQADPTSSQPQQRVFAQAGFNAEPDPREERVLFSRAASRAAPTPSHALATMSGSPRRR